MTKYPFYGVVHTLTGTALATSYTDSAIVINPSVAVRIRFYVDSVLSAGSGVTTVTIKVRGRYNDPNPNPVVTLGYVDLPTNSDAAPTVFAVGTALTVTANATTEGSFYLDSPRGIPDLIVSTKVNATGQSGDTVTVYAVAG